MATDADAPFEVGEIVRGITRAVRPFGVFVRLERGTRATDGLIRAADASRDGATFDDRDADEREVTHAMEYFYPIGSPVFVKVKRVTREGGDGRRGGGWRVALDASAVDQETGDDLDPERKRWTRGGGERDERFGGGASAREGGAGGMGGTFHPELHKIYRAKCRSVKPVGVFVDVRGFRRGGLVHRSQISQYLDVPRDASDEEKISIIAGVVAEGDDVWVKVVDVETQDGGPPRVSLSMKSVDQGNGEDLDPNNLSYDAPFRGGGGSGEHRYKPVGADAGETTRAGEIRWGHHAGDVKQYDSGGKQYELVLDDDAPGDAVGATTAASGLKFGSGEFINRMRAAGESPTRLREGDKKRKKDKKEKKEKKSKRRKKSSKRSRRDYSSDSYSSDSRR